MSINIDDHNELSTRIATAYRYILQAEEELTEFHKCLLYNPTDAELKESYGMCLVTLAMARHRFVRLKQQYVKEYLEYFNNNPGEVLSVYSLLDIPGIPEVREMLEKT